MGWSGGTSIFNAVYENLQRMQYEQLNDHNIVEILKDLIQSLWNEDWDTEFDSGYIYDDLVKQAIVELDSEFYEKFEPEEYCQDCGALLDEDAVPYSHDVIRRPYITASGDLYCDVCGSQYDQEEWEDNDDWDWYPTSYDMVEEVEESIYIGEKDG